MISLMILFLFLICLTICLAENALQKSDSPYTNPEVLVAFNAEDNVFYLILTDNGVEVDRKTITALDSIYNAVNPWCSYFKTDEPCAKLMDSFSVQLHGLSYTQSVPNATVFDYEAARSTVVHYLQMRYQYQKYLEIGTWHDDLFNLAKGWYNYTVGVDPEQGGTHRMTSNEFFEHNNTETFDLIFVDGSHEANQVFRDVHNALKVLNPGTNASDISNLSGTILMHDCNPRYSLLQEPLNGAIRTWTGDTWKAVVALRLVKNIEIVVCDFDYGVGVIRRRENRHPLPERWVQHLDVSPISMLDYDMLERERFTLLRLMSFYDMVHWLDEEEL